jgi:cell wall-associated NlpC family hydrolase
LHAAESKRPSWIAPAQAAASQAAASAWSSAEDLGTFALGLVGVRYRYGGADPDQGLDCSGLIQYVFEQVTGVTLPRTSRELAKIGDRIPLGDLAPGDLVFFNTRRFAFSHVGLYLGDNRFIHAPSRGRDVVVASLADNYWKKRFDGARRLIGVLPALVPGLAAPALAATLGQGLAATATASELPGISTPAAPETSAVPQP